MQNFIDIFLHLDTHLNQWVAVFGPWIYVILFLIIFCETGLVIMPFLPGDSLLFALGALCATTNPALDLGILIVVLLSAAILGDAVNYSIGKRLGPSVFTQDRRWLKKDHLAEAHAFYQKHGGKTIVLARFLPIIRTFAPFVAGVAEMPYTRFALFNVLGAGLWVVGILFCGYFLGNVPFVKANFEVIVVALVVIPAIPALIKWICYKKS